MDKTGHPTAGFFYGILCLIGKPFFQDGEISPEEIRYVNGEFPNPFSTTPAALFSRLANWNSRSESRLR
jgi:hypothetical protein